MAHNPERAAAARARTLELHQARMRPKPLPDLSDPQLKAAWHSLQLHWMSAYPEYRAALAARVSEAAKRAEALSKRIDAGHVDVDYLGREVDGCG